MFAAVLAEVANVDICIKNGDAIAFPGDAITSQGNGFPAGYVNPVMKGLEIRGVSAKKILSGIGGNESVQMNERLDRNVISQKPQLAEFAKDRRLKQKQRFVKSRAAAGSTACGESPSPHIRFQGWTTPAFRAGESFADVQGATL